MSIELENRTGDPLDDLKIVRVAELCSLLDVSRATLHRMRKRGEIPPPKRYSANVVGWSVATLREWHAGRRAA